LTKLLVLQRQHSTSLRQVVDYMVPPECSNLVLGGSLATTMCASSVSSDMGTRAPEKKGPNVGTQHGVAAQLVMLV
jgi:hypothetical protein